MSQEVVKHTAGLGAGKIEALAFASVMVEAWERRWWWEEVENPGL